VLKQHCAPITIIEGEARGADSIAREEALALGYEVLRFPANWRQHGKAAGMIRNRQMLVEGKPNLVYAFPTSVNSIGTRNMVGSGAHGRHPGRRLQGVILKWR
jgi:hypothetical protein